MSSADVSVLLLTKNGLPDVRRVFERVRAQSTDRDVEIVVVDSGSTDGTTSVAETYADVFVEIPPEDFHHGRTRNLAAEQASGDVLVYLTQDAVPADDEWLARLTAPLADPDVGIAYGRQVAKDGAKPMEQFFYSYFYPEEERTLDHTATRDERRFYLEHIYISDVCAAMERGVWKSVRFEDDVAMSEDKDFALRALRAGHGIVYEPSAVVRHSHDYSLRSLFVRRFKDGAAFARIASTGDDTFLSDGIDYLLAELRFLVDEGYAAWLPYALLYDAIYYVAFQFGKAVGRLS
ncbi:glycosyltransferase family 2 protein [Halomicroarcula sp. S1AR25-4]|uniref:glycosyltransferase family 2 protein n=1 Tax=Haloarcula sp. S1AR25-4 TaxID=2950538 RepID=UPI0028761B7B|nr:glycosyltransferase family A protein [Halomicroarcula sp. S1AR25-4]MDS0278502.1 glycosyltransferase family 2 protein [Halomicroarcula sp. S1AR25-4]